MRGSQLASAGLLVAVALGSAEVGASNGAHRDAIRNFLIVKHCGLETYEVRAGFRVEVIGLIGRDKISATAAKTDREAVAEEMRRDWRNRGMGQADPRCLTKGRAAVHHFLAVLNSNE